MAKPDDDPLYTRDGNPLRIFACWSDWVKFCLKRPAEPQEQERVAGPDDRLEFGKKGKA